MQRLSCWGLRSILGVFPMMLMIVGPIVRQATAQSPTAHGPAAQRRVAAEYVSKALQAETEGKNSRREALLGAALEAAPDFAAAHWHSGYVRADNRWVKFDEVSATGPQADRLATYHRLREKYRETVEDQLALAGWCKKAGLQDQWRAHLGNVLALNPDHPEARAQLGYQRVDGVWLTPQEIAGAKARAAAALAALNKWKPKLLAIRNSLKQSSPNGRELAIKRLAAVQDAAAIPALELVFCGDTEPMALAGVNHFAEMSVADASLALARQALFSPWEPVRKAAVNKLKTRNRETYVPELLSAMASPTQSRIELFQDPAGRLLYRHAFYQPGQDRDELAVFDTMYGSGVAPSSVLPGIRRSNNGLTLVTFDDGTQAIRRPDGTMQPVGPPSAWGQSMVAMGMPAVPTGKTVVLAPANPAAAQAATQTGMAVKAAATAQARETAVAAQNARTAAQNAAICELLSETTGENLPPSPEDWSKWWVDTEEVYVPGYKPIESTYVQTTDASVVTVPFQAQLMTTAHCSCLAAGTPIWTDAGPVAVEKIKVGDRVLSQHPETGELAYKPVLHTTVRLKAELVKLELAAADPVTCSVGHGFWIAGKGWVKARDIEPQMNFHGAMGTTPLRRSEPAGVGSVYNLIVADFHSYFVGDAMIYSHDITARKPSDLPVPGLARR